MGLGAYEPGDDEDLPGSFALCPQNFDTLPFTRWSLILFFLSEVWIKKLTSNKQTMAEVEGSDY